MTILVAGAALSQQQGAAPPAMGDDPTSTSAAGKEGKKSSSGDFRVAQLDQGKSSGAAAVANQAANSQQNSKGPSVGLDEIIVTAQKRSETLFDVPTSISAISGERLEALRVNSLSDLASFVPGLSVTDGGAPGSRIIEIRGLSTNYHPEAGPLVGTYIDDLPVGDSTNNAHGGQYGLDLNPYDVERVEVLKGPQGTLYGANTMGGLVKYVMRKPGLSDFDAQAGTDVSDTKGADNANWGVHAAVNLPLVTNKLAVGLSGFETHTAGYIDNVITGAKDVNHSTESGGRGSLLWQVTDDFTVHATVLAQDVNAADMSAVTLNGTTLQPVYGPNTVGTYFAQPDRQQSRIYSVGVDWDLKFATLTREPLHRYPKMTDTV